MRHSHDHKQLITKDVRGRGHDVSPDSSRWSRKYEANL